MAIAKRVQIPNDNVDIMHLGLELWESSKMRWSFQSDSMLLLWFCLVISVMKTL